MELKLKADVGAATLLAALVALAACRAPLPAAERRWRAGRQQAIAAALADAGRSAIALAFFPYDPAYRFRTVVEPVVPPEPLRIPASDGSVRPAHRVGRVTLRLPGGEARLALYALDDLAATLPDHLFLPFRDAGAGRETYGAGRYVDVVRLPGGVVEVDLNRAYNPDCAYGLAAQCPVTPEENTLPFAVAAGERMPPAH